MASAAPCVVHPILSITSGSQQLPGMVSCWRLGGATQGAETGIVFSGVRCYLVKVEKVLLRAADVTRLTRYLCKEKIKDKAADESVRRA